MQRFIRVRAREIIMDQHRDWRRKVASKFVRRFGYYRASVLESAYKICFDIQPEPIRTEPIVRRMLKQNKIQPLISYSLN